MTDQTAATTKPKPDGNPWYLLATLYGEPSSSDEELQLRNRVTWNRYVISLIGEVRAGYLLAIGRHSPDELKPFSIGELQDVEEAFLKRSEGGLELSNLPENGINFTNVEFEYFFVNSFIFPIKCDFRRTSFLEADFRSAVFCDGVSFDEATFLDEADFASAEFHGYANFEETKFPDMPTDFDHAIFSSWATFERATFPSIGGFIDVTFAHHANFRGTTFSDTVWFKDSVFSSEADFTDANISGPADFGGVKFLAEALFWRTTFSGWVSFDKAIFSSEVSFENSTFHRKTSFEAATFEASAYFVNTDMKGETVFEDAGFSTEPPMFFGAKMHEGTVWQNATWPAPPTDMIEAGGFVRAYERLKLEMDRLKKHEDELHFFARELQCRRVLYGDWKPVSELRLFGHSVGLPSFSIYSRTISLYHPAPGLPIALYGLLCDYGRSYGRPLCGILVTVVTGIPLFWLCLSFGQAISLSLANTFGALGFRKDFIAPRLIDALPGILEIVAGLQTISGTVLLFLLGLSLRNRLRMK